MPYLCRKSSSFSTQIGKIFKRRMSIGYFSTFQKSVCCIFISVVSLFIVSSPPGIGNIFFWWITLNKVFLRSLCFAEVDNPTVSLLCCYCYTMCSLLTILIKFPQPAKKILMSCWMQIGKHFILILISSLESVTACWVCGRLGLFQIIITKFLSDVFKVLNLSCKMMDH